MAAVQPTYTGVTVKEDDDTRVIILACNRGALQRVKKRVPKDKTENLMRDGYIFVYEEKESGIRRWTDIGKWTVHNKRGNFTTSREEHRRLIKHSFNTEQDGKRIHIIAYSAFDTQLLPASQDPDLRRLAFEHVPRASIGSSDGLDSTVGTLQRMQETPLPSVMSNVSTTSYTHSVPYTASHGSVKVARRYPTSGGSMTIPTSHGSVPITSGSLPITSSMSSHPGGHWAPLHGVPQDVIPPPPPPADPSSSSRPPTPDLTSSVSSIATTVNPSAIGSLPPPSGMDSFVSATTPNFIYSTVDDPAVRYMARFLGRLRARHSTTTICYAAIETFVFTLSDSPMMLVLLATLRPERDMAVTDNRSSGANAVAQDLMVSPSLICPPKSDGTGPLNWLETQGYASQFPAARCKAALWSLGHLPPKSHAHDSTTFKWLKQELRPLWTSSGMQHYAVISSGDSRYPLPPLHQLKSQLSHEANQSLSQELLDLCDEELAKVNEDCCEDWLIAVHDQLDNMPEWHAKLSLLIAYQKYMVETILLDERAFQTAGYTFCPRLLQLQTYPQMTFQQLTVMVEADISILLKPLYTALFNDQNYLAGMPSNENRMIARRIGHHFYYVRHSYVLLNAEQLAMYHSVTFDGLMEARSKLLAQFPNALIWNYLPYEVAASAKRKRLNAIREARAVLIHA